MAKLPTGRRMVSAPENIGVVQPRGLAAQAQAIGVVGDMFSSLQNTFYDIAAKDAEKKGLDAANSFVFHRDEMGNIIPPESLVNPDGSIIPTIYDESFRKQATARYEMEIDLDANKNIAEIAAKPENRKNTANFTKAIDAYRATMSQAVPDQLKGVVDTIISKRATQHIGKVIQEEAIEQREQALVVSAEEIRQSRNDAIDMVRWGATPEQVAVHRAEQFRAIEVQDHLYSPVEMHNLEKEYDRHIATAMIFNDMKATGMTTVQGLAEQEKIQQEIANGTYEINMPGIGWTTVGEVFGEERLKVLSTRANEILTNNSQMRNMGLAIGMDTVKKTIQQMYLQAGATGDPVDMFEMVVSLSNITEPDIYFAALRGVLQVDGFSEAVRDRALAIGNAELQYEHFNNLVDLLPKDIRSYVRGNMSKEEHDIEFAYMNERDPGNAASKLNALQQRLSHAMSNLPTKADMKLEMEIDAWKLQYIDRMRLAENYTGSKKQIEQAAIAESKLPNKDRFREYVMDSYKADYVDYRSISPEDTAVADGIINETVKRGFVSESLTNAMVESLVSFQAGGDAQSLLMQAERFNQIRNDSDEMRQRLATQMGADNFAAFDYFIRSGQDVNSPELWSEIHEIRTTGTLGGLVPEPKRKQSRAMLTNVGSKEWKKLPDETKGILEGTFGLFSKNRMPATVKMQAEYIDMWTRSSAMFGMNSSDHEVHHAYVMARLGDKYIESKGAWDAYRERAFSEDVSGALPMYVAADNAPEYYYQGEPGALEKFEQRVTEWISVNYPGADLKYGESFFVEPSRFLNERNNPLWQIIIPDENGIPLRTTDTPGGGLALFDFSADFQKVIDENAAIPLQTQRDFKERRMRDEMMLEQMMIEGAHPSGR